MKTIKNLGSLSPEVRAKQRIRTEPSLTRESFKIYKKRDGDSRTRRQIDVRACWRARRLLAKQVNEDIHETAVAMIMQAVLPGVQDVRQRIYNSANALTNGEFFKHFPDAAPKETL